MKTLKQHVVSASKYSITSSGLAGFTFYMLSKYAGLKLDNVEMSVFVPALTYVYNVVMVVVKKKLYPKFQEWIER